MHFLEEGEKYEFHTLFHTVKSLTKRRNQNVFIHFFPLTILQKKYFSCESTNTHVFSEWFNGDVF